MQDRDQNAGAKGQLLLQPRAQPLSDHTRDGAGVEDAAHPRNNSTTPSLDIPRKPAEGRGCRMVNHKAAFDMGEPAQRIIKSFPKAALLNYSIRQKRKRGLFQKSGTGSSC